MKDNDLIALMAAQLDAAMNIGGWTYPVIQKQQPTQQGIPSVGSVFFEKLFDYEYGFMQVIDVFNATTGNFDRTEIQNVETTFQISALVIQDPNDLTIPTASDVAVLMRQYLNSRSTINTFRAQNVGVYRITQVRNPYIEDDRHRNEATPSFDIVLTHQRPLITSVGAIDKAVLSGVYPI